MSVGSTISDFGGDGYKCRILSNGTLVYTMSNDSSYKGVLLDGLDVNLALNCQALPVIPSSLPSQFLFNENRVQQRSHSMRGRDTNEERCNNCQRLLDPYEDSIVFFTLSNGTKMSSCEHCYDSHIRDQADEDSQGIIDPMLDDATSYYIDSLIKGLLILDRWGIRP